MGKPRATSVTIEGEPDDWSAKSGWYPERTPNGETRLVCSAKPADLAMAHQALVSALSPPISVLYRQKIDRKAVEEGKPAPPSNAPTNDFISLEVTQEQIQKQLKDASGAIYEDARAELWLRGGLQEQVVLDADGLLFVYPDDPSFHDALIAVGIPEEDVETIADRDYVKHWFHAENDAQEAGFINGLSLTQVPSRR